MAARSYLVGLPVLVTVDEDGQVTATVDLAEAGAAVHHSEDTDEDGAPLYTVAEIQQDAATVDQAFAARRITVEGN